MLYQNSHSYESIESVEDPVAAESATISSTDIGNGGPPVDRSAQYALATTASWIVNWCLFVVKLLITIVSSSKAITAALIDSAVDLLSQGLLSSAENNKRKVSVHYPIGRSRLESLSVLACAVVMIFASVEVVQFSVVDLYNGIVLNKIAYIETSMIMFSLLAICTIAKALLYLYCIFINRTLKSDTISALSEDHLNDVISNVMAIFTAAIAGFAKQYWYMDPLGAMLISAVIIYRWLDVIKDQVKKLVGYTASSEFITDLNDLAEQHDPRIAVDVTRAYYFGSAYNCEMEIIMPADMSVKESHDIALELQHKIEALDDIERAFVHVDYQARDGLEHKIERNLHLEQDANSSGGNSPTKMNMIGTRSDKEISTLYSYYQDRFGE